MIETQQSLLPAVADDTRVPLLVDLLLGRVARCLPQRMTRQRCCHLGNYLIRTLEDY